MTLNIFEGGFVYQNSDCICDNEVTNAKLKSNREATAQEKLDLEIAWKVAGLTKSNCVVYVKNGAMVAVGMGMDKVGLMPQSVH